MIRAITISREYGSGGSAIARILAGRLGWRLVDNSLLDEIAKIARVDARVAASLDEAVDPWSHRLLKALWRGGYEGAASTVEGDFDADAMARLCGRVIREAAGIGNCVIVGRGGQCILQNRRDAFHVSIYAPLRDKLRHLQQRLPDAFDLEAVAEETDRRRAAYIRRYFGQDWTNRHLYHLMLCSSVGMEHAAEVIRCAAGLKTLPPETEPGAQPDTVSPISSIG